MINSMTGFGRAVRTLDGFDIQVELRSVNSRYLDLNIKLQRSYSFAEDRVRALLQKRFSRGKLDVYVSVDDKNDGNVDITLNEGLLKAYMDAFARMHRDFGLRNDLTGSSAARLPDVITVNRAETDPEQLTADICRVLDEAADSFAAMRAAEGKALADDVSGRLDAIEALVSKVEERSPQTVEEYRVRLEKKLAKVLEDRNIDEARIITEAAIFADRVDVSEETVRLRSHIAQARGLLEKGGPVGRKLDFIAQEMNREVNTTGSKCSDLELTQAVVEMKALLEKIREQIANIE